MMLLNSDFSQRAIVTPDDYQWIPSPQPGVKRVMLDRIGREQARATSLVRYAPGSEFPAHNHPGGEEILVLEGTFTENGVDHPAGWYLRSPDGSSHQPSSRDGTTIFVKLRQMSADERQPVRINTQDAANWHGQPQRQVCPLFSGFLETVLLQKLAPGERIFCAPLVGGAEILLLQGELHAPEGCYGAGSWLRFPPGDMPALMATASGALFYLKTGHLSPITLTGATL
ncbi:cupin domain-containing protein [Klebsiella pneumoniae]|uniref:cupin domain-containing protein n=1 Tax=Klebsiella pneumoniae TaxID=573 RepID=UPI000D742F9E|nr:cupin domain-containing protein [Klebsiella pneumoniae]PXH05255.1 anti-sigma factor [Klebsiella pneumoniae]